jgi:hypothetical protein
VKKVAIGALAWLALGSALGLTACDDDAVPSGVAGGGGNGDGGGQAGSTRGGAGGEAPAAPEVSAARAPDRDSVAITFSDLPAGVDMTAAASYALSDAETGDPLPILEVTLDEATRVVTLHTEKQKLGRQLRLELSLAGIVLPDDLATFYTADTAHLWAQDLTASRLAMLELVADRVLVGDHIVMYVEQGTTPTADPQEIADAFESQILPKETQLFGETTDVDDNGRLAVLFFDSPSLAGYTLTWNTWPDDKTFKNYGLHTNEMEIVYLSNDRGSPEVMAHELNHLIYYATYPNVTASWKYFKEGMAESAINAVFGEHQRPIDYISQDLEGTIADGVSLVNFVASYEHYALPYFFFSYAASQLGGVDGYSKLFSVDGTPVKLDALLQAELGKSLVEVMTDTWIALYVQAPTGPLGFGGLIDLQGARPAMAADPGALTLESYGAVLVEPWANPIDYPGTQGPDIFYVGIDAAGNVDREAPFETAGGALLAVNGALRGDPQAVHPATANLIARGRRPEAGPRSGAHLHAGCDLIDDMWERRKNGLP